MNRIPSAPDITQLSFADRQLIVVLRDELVEATSEAQEHASASDKPVDWKAIATQATRTALRLTILAPFADIAAEAVNAWARARASGLTILQVSRSSAQQFQFPPGHPRDGVLYVAHPAIPSVYYTTATFHRMAFEHKFSEAVQLLMSLGASEIVVEHVRGWSREFSAKISAPLPAANVVANLNQNERANSSLLFEAFLSNPQAPIMPDGLVWYAHEPTWQTIAQGRLKYGLHQFSLSVNYEDDFGINAGLKVGAQKAGLELGGSFEDHQATTWKIHGKFA